MELSTAIQSLHTHTHIIFIYTGAAGTRRKTKISFLCNYGVRFVLFCVYIYTYIRISMYVCIVGTLKFSWPVLIPEYIRARNYGEECNGLYFFHGPVHTRIYTDQIGRTVLVVSLVTSSTPTWIVRAQSLRCTLHSRVFVSTV